MRIYNYRQGCDAALTKFAIQLPSLAAAGIPSIKPVGKPVTTAPAAPVPGAANPDHAALAAAMSKGFDAPSRGRNVYASLKKLKKTTPNGAVFLRDFVRGS